ncbi:50S ribosomal protein L18 [Candidatus Palauibacter sp.]|uniref:50S ribosomal protein L18 n=1 Tax=Candidatus Palauibacter sp. TaxID=3101350 RepID=UPI003B52CEF1
MDTRGRTKQRHRLRIRRHARIKKKIRGTAERPRLVVFRSLRHLEGQLVDDDRGVTLLGVSTLTGPDGDAGARSGKVAEAYLAGRMLAERAVAADVGVIVFDRGGYPYHGRVRAFAEGARDGGLRF